MADEPTKPFEIHEACGHAWEAHSDANGCELCDCTEDLGRALSGGGEAAVIEAPVAEGGAHG